MENGPFDQSTQSLGSGRQVSFLERHCAHESLAAMAIIFGLGFVISALVFAICGVVTSFFIGSGDKVLYGTLAAWAAFNTWFWVSLVKIGRTNRKSRVSDREIFALQGVCFVGLTLPSLFSSSAGAHDYLAIGLVFDFCALAFHILYFLLALCVWVRVPFRSFVGFAILVPLTICRAMHV